MPKLVPVWLYYVTVLVIVPAVWALVYMVMARRERRRMQRVRQLAQRAFHTSGTAGNDYQYLALEDFVADLQQRMMAHEETLAAEIRLLSQSMATTRDTLKGELDRLRDDLRELQQRRPGEATAVQKLSKEIDQLKFKVQTLRTPLEARKSRRSFQAEAEEQAVVADKPEEPANDTAAMADPPRKSWRDSLATAARKPAPAEGSSVAEAIYGLDNVTQFPRGRSKPV